MKIVYHISFDFYHNASENVNPVSPIQYSLKRRLWFIEIGTGQYNFTREIKNDLSQLFNIIRYNGRSQKKYFIVKACQFLVL